MSFYGKLCVIGAIAILSSQVWALTFDSDVPAALQQQMNQDLSFAGSLQGAKFTPLAQKVYSSFQGPVIRQWFEGRVLSVGLDDCGGNGAVACVIPYLSSTKIWITNNYIQFSHPQVARMMIVYHEARHTETQNNYWYHANCPKPFVDENGREMKSIWTGEPLAGKPGCDRTEFGSYGSSTILLKNIAKFCLTCNEKVKMDADLYSNDQIKRIIDQGAKQRMVSDFAIQ